MHSFTSMQSFYDCNFLYFAFVLLFGICNFSTDQNFYGLLKARINITSVQIIFCHYVYENYNYVSFNLYLRELYFMLYNAYYYRTMTCRYWNLSWLDILFHKEKSLLCFNHDFLYFFYNLFLSIFALKAGYIELNSEPKKKSN